MESVDVDVADALTIGADSSGLWVTFGGRPAPASPSGEVSHVDGATLHVNQQFATGWAPIDVTATDNSLWVVEGDLDGLRQGVVEDVVDRFDRDGQVLARIAVPGPIALTAGLNSLWVISGTDRSLLRIDPVSNELAGEITLPDQPVGLAICGGSVWVLAAADDGSTRLSEIDPGTGEVVRKIELMDGGPGTLVANASSVWVVLSAVAPGMSRLVQVDPNTGQEIRRADIPGNRAVSVGEGTLWLGASDGRLQAIDLVTWMLNDVADIGSDIGSVAAAGDSVWVLGNGVLERWSPTTH
jgi:hypothetical protein